MGGPEASRQWRSPFGTTGTDITVRSRSEKTSWEEAHGSIVCVGVQCRGRDVPQQTEGDETLGAPSKTSPNTGVQAQGSRTLARTESYLRVT